MKISVFGVGYVGTVLAACMVEDGHEVVAVDVSAEKVRTIKAASHHGCGRGDTSDGNELRLRGNAEPPQW